MVRSLNKYKGLLILLSFLSFSSCIFRPEYHRPYVDVPESWRLKTDEGTEIANLRWWEQFNDPVLNELIITALQNNNDLKIAVARVYEFYYRLGVTSSALWPEIDGQATASRNLLSLTTIPSVLPRQRLFTQYTALLSLTYEVDVWGRIHSATDAALAELLAEIEARRAVVLTLVTSVAITYIQLRQYDKQLEIANETYKSRIESARLAKIRFDEGLTSELEVEQAASEVQSALVEVKQLEILIPQTENQLSVLLGINPQEINRGTTIDKMNMPPQVPTGLPSDLLENRPDILKAEQILSATVSRVGEARAAMFPQISLTGAYGNESSELHQLLTAPSRVWDYGISLLTPVFDAGRLAYTLDIAIAQKQEALFEYFQVILTAFAEVDTALNAHQKTKELVEVLVVQVKVLTKYLELATLRYNNGQTDYLNVLDAERTLFAAQLDLAAAQGEAFTTLIQLYAALGGGWVIDADMGLPTCKE